MALGPESNAGQPGVHCMVSSQSRARVLLKNSASPGGGGLTPPPPNPPAPPPPPLSDSANFSPGLQPIKVFSGAFGASQFRPKNLFGASNNSGSPEGVGGGATAPPPLRETLPRAVVTHLVLVPVRYPRTLVEASI